MTDFELNAHTFNEIYGFPPSFAENPVGHPKQLEEFELVEARLVVLAEETRAGRKSRTEFATAISIAAVCLAIPRQWNGDFPGWVEWKAQALLDEAAGLDSVQWLG